MRRLGPTLCLLLLPSLIQAAEPQVTGIRAVHRHGQTFVTWRDVAEGEAGAAYRYILYRSDRPITAASVDKAEVCASGILNNSAKLFGSAFNAKDRADPGKPYSVIEAAGKPLPAWSGLAVHTVPRAGKSYYAVVATDVAGKAATSVVPGQSATTEAIEEQPGPLTPIKLYDSKERGRYSPQTSITGAKKLPLHVELHASSGGGGGASDYGDYYLYFSPAGWGYREGLPGVFSVQEARRKEGNQLLLRSRDAIEHPAGKNAMETYWFGYLDVPQGAPHQEPRAYNYTERRMLWIVDWTIKRYDVDPEHVTAGGGSMGAWGSTTFAFRHPEIFAAVYPNRPRTRQKGLPSLVKYTRGQPAVMADGKTDYFERMDMVKFAADHPGDLPFYGWCCGRRDGFASWQEQVDMIKALSKAHHGFAFAWNNGDHSSGAQPMARVLKYYPPDLFARNQSYPAFANSSLDDNPGNGDPKEGDLEGGINLGFHWKEVADMPAAWSVLIGNELAKSDMTVDVTPRRCQQFKSKPGDKFQWSTSSGGSGTVTADEHGLVTVPGIKIQPGKETKLTLRR
ncbi:MAG: hypothetical protein AB7K24_00730 [Gemmataceae bacterium]